MKRALSIIIVLGFLPCFSCGNVDDSNSHVIDNSQSFETVPPTMESSTLEVNLDNSSSPFNQIWFRYACAGLKQNGELYMWGRNNKMYKPFGMETEEIVETPIKVLDNVEYYTMDEYQSAAITKDRKLYIWGSFTPYGDRSILNIPSGLSTPILEDVVSVDISNTNGAAITSDGTLYTWGTNHKFTMGDNSSFADVTYTPTKIMENIVSVAVSETHCAAITAQAELYMWGEQGGEYKTPAFTLKYSHVPFKVMENVSKVFLNNYNTAIITTDKSLYMCGDNSTGILGNGTTEENEEPVKVLENVDKFSFEDETGLLRSSYSTYCAAITENGTLYIWGKNDSGQVGNGEIGECVCIPYQSMENIKSVSIRDSCTLAITNDNELFMWGNKSLLPYKKQAEYAKEHPEYLLSPQLICKDCTFASLIQNGGYMIQDDSIYEWGNPYWNTRAIKENPELFYLHKLQF